VREKITSINGSLASSDYSNFASFEEIRVSVLNIQELIKKNIQKFMNSQAEMLKLNQLIDSNITFESNWRNKKSKKVENENEFDSNESQNCNRRSTEGGSAETVHTKLPRLSRFTSKLLAEWFKNHIEDPYPNFEEKVMLASKTNTSVKQVWVFITP